MTTTDSGNSDPNAALRRMFVVGLCCLTIAVVYFVTDYFASRGIVQSSADSNAAKTNRSSSEFDLSHLAISKEEIHSGGPAKDGIPSLTDGRFVTADAANHLQPDDRVIGITFGEVARAYPLKVLNFHEIVNDRVGGMPVAVTYCPLCDSAAVFDRRTEFGEREFGVSGLLYNSNVLMYDRGEPVERLWSQMRAAGISADAVNSKLTALPLELTTWQEWSRRYPHTDVLSTDTGHDRDYDRSPYTEYLQMPDLMFPVSALSDRLPRKQPVLGMWTSNSARAYPESAFSPERSRIEDSLGGLNVVIEFNPQSRSLRVAEAEEGVQWVYAFWFAWYAFHPDTDVWSPSDAE